eukprot:2684393-Ditylum_brightwellii.AAC.1
MDIKMAGANATTIKDNTEDYDDMMPTSSTIDSTSKNVNNTVTTVAVVKMTSTGGTTVEDNDDAKDDDAKFSASSVDSPSKDVITITADAPPNSAANAPTSSYSSNGATTNSAATFSDNISKSIAPINSATSLVPSQYCCSYSKINTCKELPLMLQDYVHDGCSNKIHHV